MQHAALLGAGPVRCSLASCGCDARYSVCRPSIPGTVLHPFLPSHQAEPYVKPVQLNATEAVLARCGDAERLLLRVQRVATRPAPEPPLAKREAEPHAAAAAGKPPRLNVLVLFIDSLGRRHFFRRMPKAAAALEAVARSRQASLFQFFRWAHCSGGLG